MRTTTVCVWLCNVARVMLIVATIGFIAYVWFVIGFLDGVMAIFNDA